MFPQASVVGKNTVQRRARGTPAKAKYFIFELKSIQYKISILCVLHPWQVSHSTTGESKILNNKALIINNITIK